MMRMETDDVDRDRWRRHASGETLLDVLLSPPCLIAVLTAYGESKRRQAARVASTGSVPASPAPSPTINALSTESMVTPLELARETARLAQERLDYQCRVNADLTA